MDCRDLARHVCYRVLSIVAVLLISLSAGAQTPDRAQLSLIPTAATAEPLEVKGAAAVAVRATEMKPANSQQPKDLEIARTEEPANPQLTQKPTQCKNTIKADVVALDQVVMINRLGTVRPGGMIFALRSDVIPKQGSTGLKPGNVMLRQGKRPRPMVLRVNAKDCLQIKFQNLLQPDIAKADPIQPVTRNASLHITGMQLVSNISDDGTYAGANPKTASSNKSGLVAPGRSAVYTLYAESEGSYLLYSTSADFNGFNTMQLTMGLFGAVNVEPEGAEWYRSQVTQKDLKLATKNVVNGQPVINYNACYPDGRDCSQSAPDAKPILRMLNRNNEIVHTDLTALITGPGAGRFTPQQVPAEFDNNPALPDRRQPYREVTIHYHESQDVVQAFPYFYNANNVHTPDLNSGQDSFAINYAMAGIGAEIVANRMGVGPARNCVDCKFEEFFLSSWPNGDPAMIVDVPANSQCTGSPNGGDFSQVGALLEPSTVASVNNTPLPPSPCTPYLGPKASLAYFPDDPSNVYHTYLGDHVKFQILHAGASVHHVHHHHAHQWLFSPNSDESNYLDSQAIGPGSSFTLELVYNGSGNLNKTVGDSIFHCHFYPHFASGMWGLFRIHDVFEAGTPLDRNGRPATGSRALPDPEILTGTPIPAVVPLPTLPMAPPPAPVQIVNGQVQVSGDGNPGYPFFVPGTAGRRAPHPPLDFAVENNEKLDGGLPRHILLDGQVINEQHTPFDFSKDLGAITAFELPEEGTPTERTAMAYFAQRTHKSITPEGKPANFITNGLPRKTLKNPLGSQSGAPFADPGVDPTGKAVGNLRIYKGAALQVNTVMNKKGWHYPQQRMMALWGDVNDIFKGVRPPEPLFFRANSGDVVEFWHANLIPAYYELDDFQVRTPTDIVGQHIHLVKFDVMASDGAANGFNYEDGTFSPDEVRSRIDGINQNGGLWDFERKRQKQLKAKSIAALGNGQTSGSKQWLGAQATVQRWYVDPLKDSKGVDRTYMTVFTHDHFGPSTHQMASLYGGLLVEPTGSTWTSPDGTQIYGSRALDGGPTSYAANIIPANTAESYREFALAWQDSQLVYAASSKTKPDCYPGQGPPYQDCNPVASGAQYLGWADPANAINAPTFPNLKPPTPLLIYDFGQGTFSLNYRNEPLPFRVARPASAPSPQANKYAGDLSHVFRSINRYDSALNKQPLGNGFPTKPISAGMLPQDPFTPLLRAYENDKVQIRVLAGAQTSMHDFTLQGVKWLFEPFNRNSGYRNSQLVILSEHFEMLFNVPAADPKIKAADFLYNPSSSYEGLTNGIWGILRSYRGTEGVEKLKPLPNNPSGMASSTSPISIPDGLTMDCRSGNPCRRDFKISVVTIGQAMGPGRTLAYNSRGVYAGQNTDGSPNFDSAHPLEDPNAIIYVNDDELDKTTNRLNQCFDKATNSPKPCTIEPLVLRAAAGDWIHVTLTNRVTGSEPVFTNSESTARVGQYTTPYQSINLSPSTSFGLHPQLVSYDATNSNGVNVGINSVQTVAPGDNKCPDQNFPGYPCIQYTWYAGNLTPQANGSVEAKPVEFGAINLMPSDPLMHVYHGLFGALIVEPQGSTWVVDSDYRTSATVFKKDGAVFREFVLMAQNDIAISLNGNSLYAANNNLSGFNYRTEPFFYRYGARMNKALGSNAPADWTNLSLSDLTNIGALPWTAIDTSAAVSNHLVDADPLTPIFRAPAGMQVQYRLLDPGGIGDNQQVFELTGHVWQEEPYKNNSTEIGVNPRSGWTGTTPAYGTTSHYNIQIGQAGGRFKVPGDYLYRSWTANQFQVGMFGLFRVSPSNADCGSNANPFDATPYGAKCPDTITINSVQPGATGYVMTGVVTVSPQTRKFATCVRINSGPCNVNVDGDTHRWTYSSPGSIPNQIKVQSELGGVAYFYKTGLTPEPEFVRPSDKRPAIKRARH